MGICFGRAEVVHPISTTVTMNDVPLISQKVQLGSCIKSNSCIESVQLGREGCRIKLRIPAKHLAHIFSQGKCREEALASFIVQSFEAKCSDLTFHKASASWRPSLESITEEH
ncbi:hypothetical protein SUGI_1164680 [Cryptomeria japonica]|nr:hypothetical protein SUGI_1164680 [Cryptomeria japonica]